MIFILNKDEDVVEILSNNGSPNACPYYNDALIEDTSVGAATYEFYAPSNHIATKSIVEGGYVVRRDQDGYLRMFQIFEVKDRHGTFQDSSKYVYAEDAGLELNNDCIRPNPYENYSAEQIVETLLVGQRWQVGKIGNFPIQTFTFSDYETILAGLQAVATQLGGELQFRVEMKNGSVSARYIDIVNERGNVTHKRFDYSKDIVSIERDVKLDNIATALIGVGNSDLSFKDIVWSKANGDPADKPSGQDWIGDDGALQLYGKKGKHIFRKFEYSTDDPTELLQKAWAQLQIQKNPTVTYTLQVALLERLAGVQHEKVRIGDTVYVIDEDLGIELSARVVQLTTCFSDPNQDQCTLANYQVVESSIDYKMQLIESTLLRKASSWDNAVTQVKTLAITVDIKSTNGTAFKNGQLDTSLVVTVFKGQTDVTADLPASAFTWHKFDQHGTEDMAWYNAHLGIGRSVHVTYAETSDDSTFECDVDTSSLTT